MQNIWSPASSTGSGRQVTNGGRIGINEGPLPYWTDPDHVYQENEMVICALQYACPEEGIGFRYENPILITKESCDPLSKYPLAIEIIE